MPGVSGVFLENRTHVNSGDLTVVDDDLAVDHGVLGFLGGAEDYGSNRVGHATCKVDCVEIDREEISTHSGSVSCFV